MSLLSNANITRYGIISSWNSNWVESNILYTSIIYADIYINELINGIHYKLKMPNALPIIKSVGYNKTLIYVNTLLYYKDDKFYKWRHYYKPLFFIKQWIRTVLFNIYRITKHMLYNNIINLYNISMFSKLDNKHTNLYVYNKKGRKIMLYKRVLNTSIKYNKIIYKSIIKYKKKIKQKKNIHQYNKKYKNKKHKKYNRYKFNKIVNKKKKNNLEIIKSIYKKEQYVKKNINYYIHNYVKSYKKHKKRCLYKNYIVNKNKLLSVMQYIKKLNNIRYNRINTNYIRIKNKIKYKYKIKKESIIKQYTNTSTVVYMLLISKIVYIFMYIYVFTYIYYLLHKYKLNKVMLNIYTSIKHITNNIINIKKIKSMNVNKSYIFNNLFLTKINKLNLVKNNKKYSRIRSQFRLRKKRERVKKEKKYNMFRRKVQYHHYFGFVCDTPKYIKRYNKQLIYKQLCFKMNNTINEYINQNVYYIHSFNEIFFNRIDNPKLLSDLIKILMKYEEKNPNILKQIVSIHSKQNHKSKVFMRKYIRKSNIFVKKLNNKLKYNYLGFNLYTRRIRKNKKIKINTTFRNNKYLKKDIKYKITSKYKFRKKNKKNNNITQIYNYYINNKKNNKIKVISNNNIILDNKIEYYSYLNQWLLYIKKLKYKKYPLIGMRIELSGPTKKGRRTQTHLYNEWVDFYTLPGRMQLVKLVNDIKYWQSYGLTQRASIGIKVWMHFHTSRYSELNKYAFE